MAMVVAVPSGLPFAVRLTIDPRYRARFVDPLPDDVAGSLAAREVFLASWPGER